MHIIAIIGKGNLYDTENLIVDIATILIYLTLRISLVTHSAVTSGLYFSFSHNSSKKIWNNMLGNYNKIYRTCFYFSHIILVNELEIKGNK